MKKPSTPGAQRRPEAQSPRGWLYLLWAENSTIFKIGFTQVGVAERATVIESMSPLPIRVLGAIQGSRFDEGSLHIELGQYRSHGEWFSLPEEAVWPLLQRFGAAS